MATRARRVAATAAVTRLWVRASLRSVGRSKLSPIVRGSSVSCLCSESATLGKLPTRQTVRVSWAEQWREVNRAVWDERVPIHVAGEFYDVPGFLAGQTRLLPFESAELGAVEGASLVHPQCHFGLDTLSWARRGARVTGIDFSAPAIEVARE